MEHAPEATGDVVVQARGARSRVARVGIRAGVREVLSLDRRSLIAFRCALGAIVIGDLLVRARSLRAHYTDDGLFPRSLLVEVSDRWHFSLHAAAGAEAITIFLFVAAGVSAACFAVGLRPRLSAALTWALTVSLQNRNPAILSGADILLRLLLFWAVFLPIPGAGARRSRAAPSAASTAASAAVAGYVVQIVCVYVFAGLMKRSVPAWRDGLGLAYALGVSEFATPWAAKLAAHVHATRILNDLTLYVELFGPCLLLIPFRVSVLRSIAVALFFGLHLSIALVLSVGIFVPVSLAAWLPFLPSAFWDRWTAPALAWTRARSRRIDAGMSIHLLGRFVARLEGSRADPSLAERAPWARLAASAAPLGAAAYIVLWNLGALRPPASIHVPENLRWIGALLRLDQRWEMFSKPILESGRPYIPGRLRSGKEVELFSWSQGTPYREPSADTPASELFVTDRWRKFWMNLNRRNADRERKAYGRYLCRAWNSEHRGDDALEAFLILDIHHSVVPNSVATAVPPSETTTLWRHECSRGLLLKWQSKLSAPRLLAR